MSSGISIYMQPADSTSVLTNTGMYILHIYKESYAPYRFVKSVKEIQHRV